MNKPVYTTAAMSDLDSVLEYAARDKPKAAIKLVETIEAKCLLIASSPEIGEAHRQLGLGVRQPVDTFLPRSLSVYASAEHFESASRPL